MLEHCNESVPPGMIFNQYVKIREEGGPYDRKTTHEIKKSGASSNDPTDAV